MKRRANDHDHRTIAHHALDLDGAETLQHQRSLASITEDCHG
jgi:hypothetical protein